MSRIGFGETWSRPRYLRSLRRGSLGQSTSQGWSLSFGPMSQNQFERVDPNSGVASDLR